MNETVAKPQQRQVGRLRREEDEDSWISGEELHTEGSSDDDGGGRGGGGGGSSGGGKRDAHARTAQHTAHLERTSSAKRRPPPSPPPSPPPAEASEPVSQADPHLAEATRRLSEMGLEETEGGASGSTAHSESEQVEEQEEVMLWRPKRGSIKLPHLDLDAPQQRVEGVSS